MEAKFYFPAVSVTFERNCLNSGGEILIVWSELEFS